MVIHILSLLFIIFSQNASNFTDWQFLFETIAENNNIQVVQIDQSRKFELVWTDYIFLLHNNELKIYDKRKKQIFNGIKILDKNKFFPTLDNKESNGNKFISVTIQNGSLFVTIIDTNGGWSWEWIETVLELTKNGRRVVSKCFDYNNYGQFEGNENIVDSYARWTTQFDVLDKLPLSKCKDNVLIL